jgi:uncharacterized protein YndB with AHSA1/START domain
MVAQSSPTFELSLVGDREIEISYFFDAPRELVFDAMTKPEHLRNWYGPRDYTVTECEMDFRVGGKYRIVQQNPAGEEFVFFGEYREIVRPERVVQTWAFEPFGDRPSTETLTLTEVDGRTQVRASSVFMGAEDRDGVVASGMEWGARQSYERLAELIAELTAAAGQRA